MLARGEGPLAPAEGAAALVICVRRAGGGERRGGVSVRFFVS